MPIGDPLREAEDILGPEGDPLAEADAILGAEPAASAATALPSITPKAAYDKAMKYPRLAAGGETALVDADTGAVKSPSRRIVGTPEPLPGVGYVAKEALSVLGESVVGTVNRMGQTVQNLAGSLISAPAEIKERGIAAVEGRAPRLGVPPISRKIIESKDALAEVADMAKRWHTSGSAERSAITEKARSINLPAFEQALQVEGSKHPPTGKARTLLEGVGRGIEGTARGVADLLIHMLGPSQERSARAAEALAIRAAQEGDPQKSDSILVNSIANAFEVAVPMLVGGAMGARQGPLAVDALWTAIGYGDSYAEARKAGLPDDKAKMFALTTGIGNAATEHIGGAGVGQFWKRIDKGKDWASKMTRFFREVFAESLVEEGASGAVSEVLKDRFGLTPKATAGELAERIIEAAARQGSDAIAPMLLTLGAGGSAHMLANFYSKGNERSNARKAVEARGLRAPVPVELTAAERYAAQFAPKAPVQEPAVEEPAPAVVEPTPVERVASPLLTDMESRAGEVRTEDAQAAMRAGVEPESRQNVAQEDVPRETAPSQAKEPWEMSAAETAKRFGFTRMERGEWGEYHGDTVYTVDDNTPVPVFAADPLGGRDIQTTKQVPLEVSTTAHEGFHRLFSRNAEAGHAAIRDAQAVAPSVTFEDIMNLATVEYFEPGTLAKTNAALAKALQPFVDIARSQTPQGTVPTGYASPPDLAAKYGKAPAAPSATRATPQAAEAQPSGESPAESVLERPTPPVEPAGETSVPLGVNRGRVEGYLRSQADAQKVDPAHVDAALSILEANAESYAAVTGKQADDYYALFATEEGGAAEAELGADKLRFKKGVVRFLKNGKALVRFLEGADASVLPHELAHIARRALLPHMPEDMRAAADTFVGAKRRTNWNRAQEEKFANGYLRWLRDGVAPTKKLAQVFEQFKAWLTALYAKLTGGKLDIALTADIRRVFAEMTGGAVEQADALGAETAGASDAELEDAKREWLEKGTESKYFKRWFGDSKARRQRQLSRFDESAGKVVNELGDYYPMKLYHGTSKDFSVFRPGKGGAAGPGIYLAESPQKASAFGDRDAGRVLRVYAKIENPMVVDIFGDLKGGRLDEAVAKAKAAGHDGLVIPYVGEWVAFSPEQIKSATGNRGTFSPDEPSILGAEEQDATSIANAYVNQERVERGLEPFGPVETRGIERMLAEAQAYLEENKEADERLVKYLVENPEPLAGIRLGLVLHRKLQVRANWESARRRLEIAEREGDDDAMADAYKDATAALVELDTIDYIGKQAGTLQGRDFNARKMLQADDFSFAGMVQQATVQAGGRELTEDEIREVEALRKTIIDLQAKIDAAEKANDALQTELALAEQQKELAKPKEPIAPRPRPVSPKSPDYGKRNRIVTNTMIAGERSKALAFLAKLKQKPAASPAALGAEEAVPSPQEQEAIDALSGTGLYHYEAGQREKAAWKNALTADLGPDVAPFLDMLWAHVEKRVGDNQLQAIVQSLKQRKPVGAALARKATQIAKLLPLDVIQDREALVDAVHKTLQEAYPEMTREEAARAIAGYGVSPDLSQEEVDIELAARKHELRELAKLEDMANKLAPLGSGPQRYPAGPEGRRLAKLVYEEKKKGGYLDNDQGKRLQSILDTLLARYQHDIEALENAIESGVPILDKKNRTVFDEAEQAKIDALKARRDKLKADYEAIFGKPQLSIEDQLAKAIEIEDARTTELDRMIRENDLWPTRDRAAKPAKPTSTELVAAQERHKASKAQLELLRALESEIEPKESKDLAAAIKAKEKAIAEVKAKVAAGDITARKQPSAVIQTPELVKLQGELDTLNKKLADMRKAAKPRKSEAAIALQAYKTRARNEIARLSDKLARGDFSTARPKREIAMDPEAIALRFQLIEAKDRWQERLLKYMLENQTPGQKMWRWFMTGLGIPMELKASLDLSSTYRQALFLTLGDPVLAMKMIAVQIQAWKSPEAQFAIEEWIKAMPEYSIFVRSKLDFTEQGGKMTRREELIKSNVGKHIYGIGASERAFVTGLNFIRAASMKKFLDAHTAAYGRPATLAEEKVYANAINTFTGRYPLGKHAGWVQGWSGTVFWALRLQLSRLQTLALQPIWGGEGSLKDTWRARYRVAGKYARFLAASGSVFALAGIYNLFADDDEKITIEVDPRSSEFLKLKFGKKTLIDPVGGLQQFVVLSSRLISGEMKNQRGKIVSIRGDRKAFAQDTYQEAARFVRKKFAPVHGVFWNIATGEKVIGQKTTPLSVAADLTMPLVLNDIWDAAQEHGVAGTSFLGLLSALGFGVLVKQQKKGSGYVPPVSGGVGLQRPQGGTGQKGMPQRTAPLPRPAGKQATAKSKTKFDMELEALGIE